MSQRYADIVITKSPKGWRLSEFSDRLTEMTGYSKTEIEENYSEYFMNLFAAVDVSAASEFFSCTHNENVLCPWIFSLKCANQEGSMPVLLQMGKRTERELSVFVHDGSFLGAQTEKIMNRIQSLEKSIPSGLCQGLLDEYITIIWHNDFFLEILGYTESEFCDELKNRGTGYIYPEDVRKISTLLTDALRQGVKVVTTEMRVIKHDGEVRTMLTSFSFTDELIDGMPVFYSMGVDVTDERHLREMELETERIRIAMDQVSSYVMEYDIPHRMLLPSVGLEKHFGIQGAIDRVPETLIEYGIVAPESEDEIRRVFGEINAGKEMSAGVVCIYTKGSGRELWIRLRMTSVVDEEHRPTKAILFAEDITEHHKVEMRYQEEEKRRAAMTYDMEFLLQLDLTADKILTADESRFPFFDFAHTASGKELLWKKASVCVHPDDRAEYLRQFSVETMLELFNQGVPETKVDYRALQEDGIYRWCRGVAHIIKEPVHGDICAYIYIKDIESEKNQELELHRHAEQDVLTGLYNRYTAELLCNQYLDSRPADSVAAMYMLDLDNFKYLNDTYGHIKGDSMLQQVADSLRMMFSKDTLLGRIGGDELIVFQTICSSREEAGEVAQAICDCLKDLEAGSGVVTVSVGVAFAPRDGATFAELYSHADCALYLAKRAGKNCYAIYEKQEGKEEAVERLPVSREWLLEESSDIIYVSDFYSYALLYMNQGARTIFGIEDDEYVGKKCYKLLQQKDHPCEFCTNHLLCREKFYSWEFTNKTVGKTLMLRDRLVDWYGVAARIEFATDVSIIGKRAQALEEQVEVDQAIISCLRILNSVKSFQDSAEPMLKELAQFHEADRAFILSYDDSTQLLTPQYEWTAKGLRGITLMWGDRIVTPEGQIAQSLFEGKNYIYDQLAVSDQHMSLYYHMLYDAGVYRQRGVPFFLNGHPAGIIGLDNPTRYQDDMTVLETLGYFITEELSKARLSENLEYLSYHDSLTGLWNRNHYVEYMEELRNRELNTLGIAVADINALKDINKLRGHSQGDQVVKRAAKLLTDSFTNARIFRLSGDEFEIYCENVDRVEFLKQIEAARSGAPSLQGYGISIGYVWTDEEVDCSKLMMQATDIMLMEKQEYYRYQQKEHTAAKCDYSRLQNLLDSLSKGYFKMYLQPKAGCSDFELNGAEALVRYESPETGLVFPDRFIPTLEQEHMIRFVDLFIFEEVCRLLARWKSEGKRMMTISLNFSRQTVLEPDLLRTMLQLTGQYQVPKDCIEVEITESLGDYESSTIAEIGARIKEAGFRLALDDFGSHYTNMDMLSIVPADVLKLDRSLIRNVMARESNKLVLKSVLGLCKDLGIDSIAEGVETEEQLELLRNLCCDSIQGYLFGRPITIDEFERRYL